MWHKPCWTFHPWWPCIKTRCLFWACSHQNSSAVQARIPKFEPKMHLSTVKIPIKFGLEIGFDLHFHFQSWNLFFYQIYLRSYDNSETIAGDRSNQFGLLTEHKFCRKLSRRISIDSLCCNRFINLGRPIFPLNHSGASAATVFTIPTTFGIAHAWCYTRAERIAQSATRVGSLPLDSLSAPSTHYSPKIVFTFSPICGACTSSIAIYLIIMRDFIFLCIGPHQQSTISSGWLW